MVRDPLRPMGLWQQVSRERVPHDPRVHAPVAQEHVDDREAVLRPRRDGDVGFLQEREHRDAVRLVAVAGHGHHVRADGLAARADRGLDGDDVVQAAAAAPCVGDHLRHPPRARGNPLSFSMLYHS